MTDQATRLRSIIGDELVTRRIQVDRSTSTADEFTSDAHSTVAGTMRRSAKAIAITSGKGGVGKSNIAVNLAASMAQTGKRVVLLQPILMVL